MGLFSKLQFGAKAPGSSPTAGGAADASEVARDARARARRRLIGASVLLGIGIVGFPLLFESRPRPIPVNIPIEIPAREGLTPLAPPVARSNSSRQQSAPADAPLDRPASATASPAAKLAEAKQAASKPEAKPEPKTAALKQAAPKPETKPEPERKPEPKQAVSKPEVKPTPPVKPPEQPAEEGRFVVQIGAFSEVGIARDARMKVEGLGLKTYTQVIESATGRRIRVRVGPYPSKAEADKAAARIKAGGLPAAVLVL